MVHLESRAVTAGLVGGVSVLLSPTTTAMFQKAGMLSPDGRCKTIDASADGYVRGEGCGVIVLQTGEAAEGRGAPVLAVFQGSAVNQDGRSSSLTAPNGPSQQAAVRQALQASALEPYQMTALQLHGTGTPLGDPIELGAAQAVLMGNSQREQPIQIAAAKSWIGHTEAASGVMGLLQAALGLQQLIAPGRYPLAGRGICPRHIKHAATAVRMKAQVLSASLRPGDVLQHNNVVSGVKLSWQSQCMLSF